VIDDLTDALSSFMRRLRDLVDDILNSKCVVCRIYCGLHAK